MQKPRIPLHPTTKQGILFLRRMGSPAQKKMKKFNVSHNKYRNFKELEKLPEIGDNYDGRKVIEINEVGMDCEQPFDDNFNYDLYEIVCEDEDVDTVEWCVCVRKEGLK